MSDVDAIARGRRPKRGPGRPSIPAHRRAVKVSVTIAPDLLRALDAAAKAAKVPRSRYIAELVSQAQAELDCGAATGEWADSVRAGQ
jgi:hypothetical protein